jgi:ubiquinone biosynthesis protein
LQSEIKTLKIKKMAMPEQNKEKQKMHVPIRKNSQGLKRYGHILNVFVRYGFGDILQRMNAKYSVPWLGKILKKEKKGIKTLSTPERVRLAFEEIGPTFIKLGQVLSSRPDLIPQDYINELNKLQDKVPPFPFSEAKATIEKQLGKPLEELFEYFEEKHTGAASLSQVHRAKSKAGDDVAVKVQRPGIDQIIETDIHFLRKLAILAERYIPESRDYQPVRIVDEFARTIRRELDFVREGRSIDRFRKHFQSDKTVHIPAVHWNLTAPGVLTMEYIQGIKVSELENLEFAGMDPNKIAIRGADMILKEIFELHLFHADPHPGNIFIIEDNVIAPVDFGMIGILNEELVYQLGMLFTAVVEKDVERIINVFMDLGIAEEQVDINGFRTEVADFLESYHDVPSNQLHIGMIMFEVMEIMRRYRLRLPADIVMMVKALVISQGVYSKLYPEFNIIEHARPYAQKLMIMRLYPDRHLKDLTKTGAETLMLLKELPFDLRKIISKIRRDEFGIKLNHHGLERTTKELERSSNRLSFSVVIAALIIGSSIIFQTEAGSKLFNYPFLGITSFLLAGVLGLWWLIGILRSGKL